MIDLLNLDLKFLRFHNQTIYYIGIHLTPRIIYFLFKSYEYEIILNKKGKLNSV